MKKNLSTLVLLLSVVSSQAQNVGIGTATPSAKLEVRNSLKSVLKISSTHYLDSSHLIFSNRYGISGTDMIMAHNQELGLKFSSSSDLPQRTMDGIMMLTPNGRVGIRKINPDYPLDLDGDFNIEGNLRVGGNAGDPGDVLSIKPNGAMVWTAPGITVTVTDTIVIQSFSLSCEYLNFPFQFHPVVMYGYPPNTGAGIVLYYAPITLPVSNAVIKEIKAYVFDGTTSGDIYVNVYNSPLTSTSFSDLVPITSFYTSGSSPSIQEKTWTPSTPLPIANGKNMYFFRVRTLSGTWPGDNSLGFKALRIIYTYTHQF